MIFNRQKYLIEISPGPMQWRSPAKSLSSVKEVIPTLLPCYCTARISIHGLHLFTKLPLHTVTGALLKRVVSDWIRELVVAFVHPESTFSPGKVI